MAYQGVLDDFVACVEGRKPARTPVFALGLEFDLHTHGVTCGESRTDIDKTVAATEAAIAKYGYDWAVAFPDDYIEFEPLDLEMSDDPDTPAMPVRYLPMERATLSRFRIPDATSEMRLPVHLEMIRRLKAGLGDSVCVVGRIAAPFSSLALIYGIDGLLTGLLLDPELVRDNTRFFVEHQVAFGKAQLEAGADLLWLGDCVAASNFISLEHAMAFAFGPAAETAAALTAMGGHLIYHAAETALPYLEQQVQLPVSAVNVGEGPSIAELKRSLDTERCLMGNFDPKLLRDGSTECIARATEAMVTANGGVGGYIFNTGEGIMTNTPAENVSAMMTAAKKAALLRR